MHIFFSGIGGTGIGPLALMAHQAGYEVSGSDKQKSGYIDYLKSKGINNIQIGQSAEDITKLHAEKPIDWLVYSSAIEKENPDHPELVFARQSKIKLTKRDEFLNELITASDQKLIAVAGTHGKTTTTAMIIWLMKRLNLPVSYSVGAKISFGEMGNFDKNAEYFVYECDEYDRNFLAFKPYLSAITGIAYDHHDIYPTESDYIQAFRDFVSQSDSTVIWDGDAKKIEHELNDNSLIVKSDVGDISKITLVGSVNRQNAWLAVRTLHKLTDTPIEKLIELINKFPGVARRFEGIGNYTLYSDYAHTPGKITGCLEQAQEMCERINLSQQRQNARNVKGSTLHARYAGIVVIYEPLTNRRQYEIRGQYKDLFSGIKKLYWVPSYLTREDPNQPVLSPAELIENMDNKEIAEPAELNEELKEKINQHLKAGDLVVIISGGGGGSLDEWLRVNFN